MTREDVINENGYFYGMAWFGAFRNHYGFTWYGDNRTSVTIDFPLTIVTYLCVLLGVATLFSTLGIRGRERWATTLRATYAVGIGSIILVCLVGHDWLVGETEITTNYLYRSNNHFRGRVGMRVALHGCNVTLDGFYGGSHGAGYVYYAESMKWRDYGREHEMISHFLDRGLPHPLLTVMDFLSVDDGGLRWGRSFHSAGYFACALLWTAFVFWIISSVLLLSVVCYGAFMFCLTGVAMVLTCVVYHVCQPPIALTIHFGDSVLTTRYGWCFWLTLASGILTLVLGGVLFVMDHMFHEKVSEFFSLENLDEDDLQDLAASSSTLKPSSFKLPLSPPMVPGGRQSGCRRTSLQITPGQRRGSIFLEPERRPSNDFANGMRRGGSNSFFSAYNGSALSVGIANKGFEQERSKSNPLFSASSASDIQEENEDAVERSAGELKVQVGGEELQPVSNSNSSINNGSNNSINNSSSSGVSGSSYGNRKPSLATMREHRENHVNEQRQSAYIVVPANDSSAAPTSIVVHCPSDEELKGVGSDTGVRTKTSERTSCDVTLDLSGEDEEEGGQEGITGEVNVVKDSRSDSAFASGAASPAVSEGGSAYKEFEDQRM